MGRIAVFVFETDPLCRDQISAPLIKAGFAVIGCAAVDQLWLGLRSRHGRLAVLGPSQSSNMQQGMNLVRSIHDMYGYIPVVLVVANSSEDYAIAALRAGVNEYVRFPLAAGELAAAVERTLRGTTEADAAASVPTQSGIIGQSCTLRDICARVERLAPSDSNVLITGESGTGKELFAALVHNSSRRRHKPFVAINCAAIPDGLLESELFGHAKGAFTGADAGQEGRLKAADQGTLFLDEIGDMSLYSQAKILRVIENREIQRLGCAQGVPVNVRVVAATNQDLDQLSRENKFRRDLYFRLNVARIHLPPLRDRKEDLPSLVEHYLDHFNAQSHHRITGIADAALDCLFAYDWPGNVRELKNLLESIFAEGPRACIELQDLPDHLRGFTTQEQRPQDERGRVLWALTATNWNKSQAAAKLRWSRMTLYRKMDRYNILREPTCNAT